MRMLDQYFYPQLVAQFLEHSISVENSVNILEIERSRIQGPNDDRIEKCIKLQETVH